MRICFVSSGLGVGGAEFALLRLCNGLASREIPSTIVSLGGLGKVGELLMARGFSVVSLRLDQKASWFTSISRLRAHLSTAKPDLVHGWMYHGNLLATLALSGSAPRPALVWGVRQSLRGTQDKFTTRQVIRACARLSKRPGAIVYNSESSRLQHHQDGFYSARGEVVLNGVDPAEFRPSEEERTRFRRAHGVRDDELLIGHIARYHRSKDHQSLLRAIAAISEGPRAIRLVLAGEGVDSSNTELTQLILNLGLEGRVLLLGRRDDVPALMPAFDLFCSSSSGMEGFQNVIAEAMSCALPSIATDVGDARTIIGDTGIVVPPGEPARLAQALHELIALADEKRRALGERARQRVTELFSQDVCTEKYLKLLRSTLTVHQQGNVRHNGLP